MYTNDAQEIFFSAINAVHPRSLMPQHIQVDEQVLNICGQKFNISSIDNFIVIAAGKAAPAMANELEKQIRYLITKGICITKYGHALPLNKIQVLEAAHPVPDKNSILAGRIVLDEVQNLSANDIVLVLLSGGASSLVADTPAGITLEELQLVFKLLVESGASIQEINIVRKHLSKIKGGQLAKAAYPAKVITLIISDVVGDDLGSIASGPTVPDNSTFEHAYNILLQYDTWIRVSDSIRKYLTNGLINEQEKTSEPGLDYFKNAFSKIIGNNLLALEAAKLKAVQMGYNTIVLEENMTGDTEEKSRQFVRYILDYTGNLPACILMGGETTLQVTGSGKGGRNQHFVLCALDELLNKNTDKHTSRIIILGAGTDGTDGPTDAAGAVIDPEIYEPGQIDILKEYLLNFDAYTFFKKNGGLLKTGPTQTNVMDIVIGIIRDR